MVDMGDKTTDVLSGMPPPKSTLAQDLIKQARDFQDPDMASVPISQRNELLLSLAEQYGNEHLQALYRREVRRWKEREQRAINLWQNEHRLTDLLSKPAVELVCGPLPAQLPPPEETDD